MIRDKIEYRMFFNAPNSSQPLSFTLKYVHKRQKSHSWQQWCWQTGPQFLPWHGIWDFWQREVHESVLSWFWVQRRLFMHFSTEDWDDFSLKTWNLKGFLSPFTQSVLKGIWNHSFEVCEVNNKWKAASVQWTFQRFPAEIGPVWLLWTTPEQASLKRLCSIFRH